MGDDAENRMQLVIGAYRAAMDDAVQLVRTFLVPTPIDNTERHVNDCLERLCERLEARVKAPVLGQQPTPVKLQDFPFPAGMWVTYSGWNHPLYVTGQLGDDGQTRYVALVCCPLHTGTDQYMPAARPDGKPFLTFHNAATVFPRLFSDLRFKCGLTMRDYLRKNREAAAALVERERG